MPARNPRVNVVLEEPLYEALRGVAKRDGLSLSLKVRDLVRKSLELEEDLLLGLFAERRERSFHRAEGRTHAKVWSHLPKESR